MSGIFGDRTTGVLRGALDGLALRQQVTSRNVANVETPGFKASTVTFEGQLQEALAQDTGTLRLTQTSAAHLSTPAAEPAGAHVIQRDDLTMRQDGNNVDIEREMTELAETTLRFAATAQLLSRKLSLLRQIVSEGRSGM